MEEILFRIIIVGDSSVGKTCFLLKFTEGKFLDKHEITVGVELGNRVLNVDGKEVKFQIWDTSGQENFRSITRSFYRRANCAILMFDLTDLSTFQNLESWVREIRQNSKEDLVIYLVGNKKDLIEQEDNKSDALMFAATHRIFECESASAKDGENVEKIFRDIGRKLLSMKENGSTKNSGKFEINRVQTSKKKKCCK